jgi:hypothetical protein
MCIRPKNRIKSRHLVNLSFHSNSLQQKISLFRIVKIKIMLVVGNVLNLKIMMYYEGYNKDIYLLFTLIDIPEFLE